MTPTTQPPDRSPLWRVMHDAYATMLDGPATSEGICYGAELRALISWLGLDEPPPEGFWPDAETEQEWQYGQRIRTLLLAEAQRAEEGADARRTTLSAYVD